MGVKLLEFRIHSYWATECEGGLTLINESSEDLMGWSCKIITTPMHNLYFYDFFCTKISDTEYEIRPRNWNWNMSAGMKYYSDFRCMHIKESPVVIKQYEKPLPEEPDDDYFAHPSGKSAAYYFFNWEDVSVDSLPIEKTPTILYAYYGVKSNGELYSDNKNDIGSGSQTSYMGYFRDFYELKLKKKFNLYLTIGGWNRSAVLSDAVSTEENRSRFVESLKNLRVIYPIFSGLVLDWHVLSNDGVNYGKEDNKATPEDEANCLELFKLIRKEIGPKFRLGMSITAIPYKMKLNVELFNEYVDEFYITSYDFADGRFSSVSTHHTNLLPAEHTRYSVKEAVYMYLGRLPAEKLHIGVATYARGSANSEGLGKPCKGVPPEFEETYEIPYSKVTGEEQWDDVAKAPYVYDEETKSFISFDSPRSAEEKCKFVADEKLKGVIVKKITGDDNMIINKINDTLLSEPRRDTV